MLNLTVCASGMVTGVGLNSPSSCAAIRCGITNFEETRFMGSDGEWITGCIAPLDKPWRGRSKLVHLVAPTIHECLESVENVEPERIPLLLCVAEKDRPGRLDGIDVRLLNEIQDELDLRFHKSSISIPQGRISGVVALRQAYTFFQQMKVPYCIIAGVDTFLTARTLSHLEKRERILTESNSDGFIPGEAGAAVLISYGDHITEDQISVRGIGFGNEEAHIDSGEPLRAEGLVQAIKEASGASGMTIADLDYRITDANGEQYVFKEAALALTRTLRERKVGFDIWHPADSVGEVGAAIVPVVLSVAMTAGKKGYAPGNGVLCHFGNDDGQRAVIFLGRSAGGA